MSHCLTGAQQTALENLIDDCGLYEVLASTMIICGDKAAHIRASYADKNTARAWDRAAAAVRTAAESKAVDAVSQ